MTDDKAAGLAAPRHAPLVPTMTPPSPHPGDAAKQPSPPQPVQWKVAVNERYQRLTDLLISLSTGALILPPIFLDKYLGVEKAPLLIFLDSWAIGSVASFGLTILFGISFHYASAKWIKQAWGQPTALSERALERLLDAAFVVMLLSFLVGIALFLIFVAHV